MVNYGKSLRHLRSLEALVYVSVVGWLSLPAAGQQPPAADCTISFNISAQGGQGPSSGFFDNRQTGCNFWQAAYGDTTFSVVTLAVQSSADGFTFATMGGTVIFGVNPLISTTAASNLINASGTNFPAFVRIFATTATGSGTLRGVLLGYRTSGSVGATAALPAGSAAAQAACTLQAAITLSGSGNTRIINAAGTGTVRICHISFSSTAAEDIQFTEGTGTNCGTGTANISGLYKSVQSMALDFQTGAPMTTQTLGDDVCLNQSAAQATGGIVIYAKF